MTNDSLEMVEVLGAKIVKQNFPSVHGEPVKVAADGPWCAPEWFNDRLAPDE